jgi:MoaA/NifB/PqqE/SkfB family radical SAM enzyme
MGQDAISYVERLMEHPVEHLDRYPKFLLIETVNTCNARCIMCGIDFDKKSKAVMDHALFAKITEDIGRHADHVEKVMPYLDGEPLLDKKLPDRVQMLKKAGVRRVNIATNASLLDEKMGTALVEVGLDEIYITIDSLKKEVYEAIRVRLDFDTVYNNIRNFIDLRNRLNPNLFIRIQMVHQALNYDEAKDFHAHWKKILPHTDQVVVRKAHNWASAAEVMSFGDEDDVNNYPCVALWGTCAIHVNGDVPLCCMDTELQHKLGNLWTQSIEEVWRGGSMQEKKGKHLCGRRGDIPICNGCTVWREERHEAESEAA